MVDWGVGMNKICLVVRAGGGLSVFQTSRLLFGGHSPAGYAGIELLFQS